MTPKLRKRLREAGREIVIGWREADPSYSAGPIVDLDAPDADYVRTRAREEHGHEMSDGYSGGEDWAAVWEGIREESARG